MKISIWYQPRGRLPGVSIDEKKVIKVVRCVSICAGAMLAGLPAEAAGDAPAGFVSVLPMMLKTAAYGSIASILASALGQGQIANLLKVATIFTCIGIIIGVIVDALAKVDRFFGMGG